MSYKPKGAPSLPSRYKKKVDSNTSTFKQRPKSRLVTVDGYELDEANPRNSVMLATEVKDNQIGAGRKLKIKINPDKVATTQRTASDKWNGNLIDARMEKHFPVGSKMALEACITEKNIKKGGETELSIVRCNWIRSVPDPSPEKSFTGVVTFNAKNGRIRGVQHYNNLVAINPATAEGDQAITELGDEMEKIVQAYRNNEYPITLGVRFRTLVKVDEENGVPVYEVVDRSRPLDWIAAEVEGEGEDMKIIKEGHPVNREYLEGNLEGYLDFVYGSRDQSQEDAEPGLVASGIVGADQELVVEVVPYRALAAAPMSKDMDVSNERSPLARLSNIMTKYGQKDDVGYIGKNWAVDGVVLLTADQAPQVRGEDWKSRNLVSAVLTDGYQNDIDVFVKAHDGGRVRVHPALGRVRDLESDVAPRNDQAPAVSSTATSASDLNLVAFEQDDDDAGAGYFSESTMSFANGETSSSEVTVEPPVAEEPPVAQESAASAPEAAKEASDEKPAAKTGGRGRFTRSA